MLAADGDHGAVATSATSRRGRERLIQQDVGDGPGDDSPVQGGGDADRDHGQVVQEVDRAVEGIDDPTDIAVAMLVIELFTDDGRFWGPGLQLVAYQTLGLEVDVGDDIGGEDLVSAALAAPSRDRTWSAASRATSTATSRAAAPEHDPSAWASLMPGRSPGLEIRFRPAQRRPLRCW